MTANREIGHVDAALHKLGPFRRYTLVQFSINIMSQFAVATHMLSIVFTGQKNPFRCSGPRNNDSAAVANNSDSDYTSLCYYSLPQAEGNGTNTRECTSADVEYQLPKNLYFVSEFDLVCEREALAGLTQTLLTLGHAVGSMTFPYFADNYGRKPIILTCSLLWLGSSIALAFAVNYTMLAVFKTLVGIFLQGVAQTSVTVMMEVLTSNQRGHMFGSLAFIFWTISIMLMVPGAYLLRDYTWRYLELLYCGYFVYIILLLFLDEPLRWLAANGLTERAMAVLKRASRWNGSNFDDVISVFYKGSENKKSEEDKEVVKILSIKVPIDNTLGKTKDNIIPSCEQAETKESTRPCCEQSGVNNVIVKEQDDASEHLNCLSLVKNKFLRNSTLFSMTAWFFNSLTYYALILMSSTLAGSLYLNFFLNSVVEIPSAIFIYFFIDRWGRKICFSMFSIIAGTTLIASAVVTTLVADELTAIKVLQIAGKFGISGSFGVIYTFTPELFPTNVRNTGLGLANMSACIGGMLAPFSGMLMNQAIYAPGLIFGLGSLVLSAWAFFLPETARRQLPQSVGDVEVWSKETKQEKQQKRAQQLSKEPDHSSVGGEINEAYA
ncbi:hypothetical protein BsWGS_01560 [Bradybaena similaris]